MSNEPADGGDWSGEEETVPVWSPADVSERRMAVALGSWDLAHYLQVVARVQLLVPVGGPKRDGVAGRDPLLVRGEDRIRGEWAALPVFTSPGLLAEALGERNDRFEGVVETDMLHLWRHWPDPQWLLAVDPLTPLGAMLPVDQFLPVANGSRKVTRFDHDVVLTELHPSWWKPWRDGPEQALLEAAEGNDLCEYLDALADCQVTVPLRPDTVGRPPLVTDPAGFPWAPVTEPSLGPVVEVFTTPELCAETYPGTPRETYRFGMVYRSLPAEYGICVNPGGPAGLAVPARDMPALRRVLHPDGPLWPWNRMAGKVDVSLVATMMWLRWVPHEALRSFDYVDPATGRPLREVLLRAVEMPDYWPAPSQPRFQPR